MKLKEIREAKKLSQEKIAKLLNIKQGTYSLYERNERKITIENLIILADFYEVSLDYLCGRPFNNKVGYIPDDKLDLVKDILALDAVEANEIHQYIKFKKEQKK